LLFPAFIFLLSCTEYTGNVVTEPDYGISTDVQLRVTAPAEFENVKPGTTYTIKWDIPLAIENISVALYKKNVFQTLLFNSIHNDGQVKWNVPSDIFNSVHYTIRVFDPRFPDIYYTYSKNFYIKADM